MRIHILTSQNLWARGFNDFYPLLKWQKALSKDGFQFRFFYQPDAKGLFECDQLWIEYRVFFHYFDTTDKTIDISPVIDYFIKAKQSVGSLVLFDTSDSTGSQCLVLTEYVDIHLKKQIYKDLKEYTIDKGDKGFMCWIPDDATPSNIKYYTTTKDHLHKFKVSWNIGLVDYRFFPLSKFYPFGTSKLLPKSYFKLKSNSPKCIRSLLTTYRGTISSDTRYSFQRKKLIGLLEKHQYNYAIKVGKPISKTEYLNEMNQAKFLFSPYGWGEVCYRDFEIFLSGSLLIKPSMDHLETFPNFYIPYQTYVPIEWDFSDAEERFNWLVQLEEENRLDMAMQGQELFLQSYHSEDYFLSHFRKMFE